MIRVLLLTWALPAVLTIIVKDPPPTGLEYKYSYNIDDPTTGDSKSQHEVRQGDVVSGSYTVLDPDGTKRTVDYTADSKRGFNAVVRTEPQAYAPDRNSIDTGYYQVQPNVYEPPQQYQPQQLQYQQYESVPQQYSQYEPAEQPMPYVQSSLYKSNYQEPRTVYFTPSSEIAASDNSFHNGQYFLPAKAH